MIIIKHRWNLARLISKRLLEVSWGRNLANHRQKKADRGISGAFFCPSAFALLARFILFSYLVENEFLQFSLSMFDQTQV